MSTIATVKESESGVNLVLHINKENGVEVSRIYLVTEDDNKPFTFASENAARDWFETRVDNKENAAHYANLAALPMLSKKAKVLTAA